MPKHVYLFEEGNRDMRDLLGGKGAGLAEMTRLGLPVPPGFTITTRACNFFAKKGRFPPGLEKQMREALVAVEAKAGKTLGDPQNPLLVSVRSGAKFSMPGMMDTILNIGLNDVTVEALAARAGNDRFAWDSYRRLIQLYGRIVAKIDGRKFDEILEAWKAKTEGGKDTDLTADMLKAVVAEYRDLYRQEAGAAFPQKPDEQLRQAVMAVFGSWTGKRAVDYRNFHGISHDLGTGANVQMMVYGNMGEDSGTGVAFTRDPATGEKGLYAEYLPNAQGEDVVAGIRTPLGIDALRDALPAIYAQLEEVAAKLEAHFRDMQDMEFTVERGTFWMLQTRTGKRTAQAAVRIAADMVREGLITKEEAIRRIEPFQIVELLMPRFRPRDREAAAKAGRLLGRGVNASPGAAAGVAILDSDLAEALGSRRFRVPEGDTGLEKSVKAAKEDLRGVTGLAWIEKLVPQAFVVRTDKGRWVETTQLRELREAGEREHPVEIRLKVVLTRTETSPEDVHGMLHAKGILTARGGATAHASVVARGLGIPCVVGCEALRVSYEDARFTLGGKPFEQGDFISIDGATGEAFSGLIAAVEPDLEKEVELRTVLEWSDEFARPFEVWANADYGRDATKARSLGAKGIGLCRTEHMFFESERLPIVHDMILSATAYKGMEAKLGALRADLEVAEAERRTALEEQIQSLEQPFRDVSSRYLGSLAKLGEFQRSDFADILRAMDGLPVVIRLIDPPLHEFLPKHEELLVEVAELRVKGDDPDALREKEAMLAAVESMRESNPMLGLRGCRLGILFPEITQMQVRAIFEAALQVKADGVDARPEVMIPLVGHANELRSQREALEAVAKRVMEEKGATVPYKFGTMIEVPRGALTADEIAKYAEFFSFGTNDLTQMTFGYSRDDAEGKFLMRYVETGILPFNPFQTLDGIPAGPHEGPRGVAKLMEIAVKGGRKTRPELKVGICGEHGGDPPSIAYCHALGLNYVSCSPFRVPVARLAAAHAALRAGAPRDV